MNFELHCLCMQKECLLVFQWVKSAARIMSIISEVPKTEYFDFKIISLLYKLTTHCSAPAYYVKQYLHLLKGKDSIGKEIYTWLPLTSNGKVRLTEVGGVSICPLYILKVMGTSNWAVWKSRGNDRQNLSAMKTRSFDVKAATALSFGMPWQQLSNLGPKSEICPTHKSILMPRKCLRLSLDIFSTWLSAWGIKSRPGEKLLPNGPASGWWY